MTEEKKMSRQTRPRQRFINKAIMISEAAPDCHGQRPPADKKYKRRSNTPNTSWQHTSWQYKGKSQHVREAYRGKPCTAHGAQEGRNALGCNHRCTVGCQVSNCITNKDCCISIRIVRITQNIPTGSIKMKHTASANCGARHHRSSSLACLCVAALVA